MLLRTTLALGLVIGPACVVRTVGTPSTTTAGVVVAAEPPPPQAEPVQVRPGFVFIGGRWVWQDEQWVWIAGHWERERAGFAWNPGRWERQDRAWIWIEGSWVASGPTTVDMSPPPPPVTAPPDRPSLGNPNAVSMLALGEGYTCSLSVAGQVRCWGYNHYGALGVGSREKSADGIVTGVEGVVRALAAGGYQTCALTATGQVWCWGSNIEGQVGNGSVAASEAPVLKPTRVAGLDHVAELHLGDKTSCAITQDRKLYCWGANAHHQIDDSSTKQITSPTRVRGTGRVDLVGVGNYHICYVSDGRAQCRGQLAPLNRDVAALTNITGITGGYGHSCAIHDGKVSCWGNDYLGVLGQGDQCAPKHDGECTSLLRPPAVVPGIDANPVEIAGSDYHTCVRFANGSVTCFGNNQGGSFTDTLPKEPWQRAHVLQGVVADSVYVGGVHVCTMRGGTPRCRGNDGAGAVRGAP